MPKDGYNIVTKLTTVKKKYEFKKKKKFGV